MNGQALVSSRTDPPPRPTPTIFQDNLDGVIDLLAKAERPLVLAGRGAMLADCRSELEDLASLIGANLATTLAANRFFSGHPRDLGVCGNVSMRGPRELIGNSDVVVAVGASLNDYTTSQMHAFGSASIVQIEIDIEQDCKASVPELALVGDAQEVARALVDAWNARDLPSRRAGGEVPKRGDVRKAILDVDLGHDPERGLDSRRVYAWLDDHLPIDRIVVTDGGRAVGGPTASLMDARDAFSWVTGSSFQSIGQGLGLAIGAAVAHPDRPVVLFCGDGGFMMALSGLDTVRLEQLNNLTIVVMNDEIYATEIKYLREFSLPVDVVEQDLPEIPLLAAAYGGVGSVVHTMDELVQLDWGGPSFRIFDVRIDRLDTLNL
jgi:thiamine pyrophosphate-dependent acetolactate synthase large subunit-like protein